MKTWIASGPDLDHATRLIVAFRDHFGRSLPSDEAIADSVARIAADGSGEFLLGAVGDDPPAGISQLRYRWSAWTTSEDCWLEDLYVEQTARRAGLGRALVEASIERARERGCARIELDVDSDNGAALALYESAGFRGDAKSQGRSLLLGRRLTE